MSGPQPRRELKVTDFPGDVQIDEIIRRLHGGTKCLEDRIARKVRAAIRDGKVNTGGPSGS